ncbi:MAG: hypothetical protein ACC645_18705, partial [Pirellulales bacterium]
DESIDGYRWQTMGTDGIFTGANEVYFASLSTGGLVEKTFTLAVVLGDMDLDGDVDFDDIDAFVLGLRSSSSYEELYGISPIVHGDLDGNGGLDFDDIDDFVAVLTGPSQRAVHVVTGTHGSRSGHAGGRRRRSVRRADKNE